MEDILIQTISTDTELAALFGNRDPETWVFQASSLGIGENPEVPEPRPYIVCKELNTTPAPEVSETSNAQWRNFTLWVYDDEGDYGRINSILRVLRRIVKVDLEFFQTGEVNCSKSRWDGFSGQFPDPSYALIGRYGTARFMVSQ